MKKTVIILSLLVAMGCASAQSYGNFAYSFGAAAGQVGNSSFVIGLPFFTQDTNTAGYSVSHGVMHAQLIRLDMELAGCQNDPKVSPAHVKDTSKFFKDYAGVDIVFRGETINVFPAGTYDSTGYDALHYNWDAQYNYDSLTTLLLNVWPIYELFDTLYLDSTEIVTNYAHDVLGIPEPLATDSALHGGPNEYVLGTVEHDCDSVRHYFVNLCGGTIRDINGNEYNSVYIGTAPQKYCWTKQNMKATKYSVDGHYYNAGDKIPNRIYYAEGSTDTTANLEIYGRLYNWYATVNVEEGTLDNPDVTTHGGFVTGICPAGWHIPDSANLVGLISIDAMDLMSDILWLIPGHDTGAGFYAKPAGLYNYNTGRCENLLGQTFFWSSVRHNYAECWVCSLIFGCNRFLFDDLIAESGASVRCVKNQMYDRKGNELND